MTASVETLKHFLDEYGWKYDLLKEDIVVTGFAGERSKFTVLIRVDTEIVVFAISPLVKKPKTSCNLNTFTYLARLNFHTKLVKFSVDEKNHIVLTVEVPAYELTYEAFVASLEALCFYADDQYQPLLEISTNPTTKLPSLTK